MKNSLPPEQSTKTNSPESTDRLISGITHDFNNLITQTYTNLEVALLDNQLNKSTKSSIESAISSLDQAIELLEKLKTISRPNLPHDQFINPLDLIKEIVKKIQNTTNIKIEVKDLTNIDICVKIEKISLLRVVENILDNAIYACSFSENPRILITASNSETAFELLIEDSGLGVPSHLVNFIFNPYFTTKKNDIGSGIGLSVSKSLILSAQGTLELLTVKKNLSGAAFLINLPLSNQNLTLTNETSILSPENLANKKIVFCADEMTIKNHLFILHKLKANCVHLSVENLFTNKLPEVDIIILSTSVEVANFGIVRLIKSIPINIPILIISNNLESSSYLRELQRVNLQVLDLPITFNALAQKILKLIFNTK